MKYINKFLDQLWHGWLRAPYTLHVRSDNKIRRPHETLVFVHGIGGSGDLWDEVIDKLQAHNTRVITLDLIGFGHSPKPTWAIYNTKFQAIAMRATLAKLSVKGKVIIIGHSLGSLVAIETALRYPRLVKQLILCSPPLYRNDNNKALSPDWVLRRLFRTVRNAPDQLIALSALATRYKLVNKSFNVTTDTFDTFTNTLEAAIVNQTAFDDATRLHLPIEIVHGLVDPVVLPMNLYALAKNNSYVHINEIPAGHEIIGTYVRPLVKIIQRVIDDKK